MKSKKSSLYVLIFFVAIFSYTPIAFAQLPQTWDEENQLWQIDRKILSTDFDLGNRYGLSDSDLLDNKLKGELHALIYPVDVTAMLIPFESFTNFLNNDKAKNLWQVLLKQVVPWKSADDFYAWSGFHTHPAKAYPQGNIQWPNTHPDIQNKMANNVMGATIINREIVYQDFLGKVHRQNVKGLTFSCAGCHSGELFGKKILGLTNRFPRANELFEKAKKVAPVVNKNIYSGVMKASAAEGMMFQQTKNALKFVGTKMPLQLGLDTSLAQVGISLNLRANDEDASKKFDDYPLNKIPADSKPMVWWNVKYKTKFLSDGALISGNPIFTNILWNELGRGTDLKELSTWLNQNQKTLQELTVMVFDTKAPKYTDFFGTRSINLQRAQRGEKHFIQSCQKCHGIYEKNWSTLETVKVTYHEVTPVIDVGTDAKRYEGIQYFADGLNRLKISRQFGTIIKAQKGYVPPPLEGIWARYPYFHNNSIPNLCALLTSSEKRPTTYYAGEAIDANRDFDHECVGYPLGDKSPKEWQKNQEYFYDTKRVGLTNSGHDKKIFLTTDGQEIFNPEQKLELIEFLKTL